MFQAINNAMDTALSTDDSASKMLFSSNLGELGI